MTASSADRRPNVILMTAHDLGQHLGCYGNPTVRTPHIDGLAEQGVRFASSFCVAPQCSPSRAALATARYPHSNGVMGLTHGLFQWELHDGETHLAQRLADLGYHTARLGVVHESNRDDLGFHERLQPAAADPTDPTVPVARGMREADCAARFIEQRQGGDQPFYLQLGFFEPHRNPNHPTHWPATHRPAERPATVPGYIRDDEDARDEFAFFEASIRTVDDAVGRILDALDRTGQADNTLVLFTADHGAPFPRAKCTLYDPGLEVPLIARWPGGPVPAGHVCDAMVSNIDYVPTLMDLLDGPAPVNGQGVSFAPALRGEPCDGRDAMFAEMTYHDYYDPMRCIRTDRYKLIVNFMFNRGFMDSSQQWRPRCTPVHPAAPNLSRHPLVELYDLHADPLEHHNLADDADHADLKRSLLERLHAWMDETADPLRQGVPVSPMHNQALALLRDDGA